MSTLDPLRWFSGRAGRAASATATAVSSLLVASSDFKWWQILLYGIICITYVFICHASAFSALIEQWRGHQFDQHVLKKTVNGISSGEAAELLNTRRASRAEPAGADIDSAIPPVGVTDDDPGYCETPQSECLGDDDSQTPACGAA